MARYSKTAEKLLPHLLQEMQQVQPVIIAAAGGGGGLTEHALDGEYHTGTLDESQAPWAVTTTIFGLHEADPDAHHNRATVVAPVAISGQQISLNYAAPLTVSGSNLALTYASPLTVTGGTTLDVLLSDGVEDSSGIRVKLPANSGIVRDNTGIYLSPATVGPATTNSVTGSGHTHTVDASSNPGAAAKILKTAADGSITLQSLTVNEGFTAAATAFRVINHTHDYPHTHVVVNPGVSWTLDEQFGVDIDDNLLVRGWIVGKHAIQLDGAILLAHYDGQPGALTGESNGHLGQVAANATNAQFGLGKFGRALAIGEATTNLVANPSFESLSGPNVANWTKAGTLDTFGQSVVSAVFGLYSGVLYDPAAGTNKYVYSDTFAVTASAYYALSAYVQKTGSGTGKIEIWWYTSGDAYISNNVITLASGALSDWTYYEWNGQAPGTAAKARVIISMDGMSGTCRLYVDGVQVEAKSYATPWTLTARAAASNIYYDLLDSIQQATGTLMCWLRKTHIFGLNYKRWLCLAATNGDSANTINLFEASDGNFYLKSVPASGTGGSQTAIANNSSWALGAWHHVAVTWDNGTITAYVDGAAAGSVLTSQTMEGLRYLIVGAYNTSGDEQANGYVDDVALLNRAATADEIRAVYESNAPVFAETSTWHWRSGRNRVWADAEGLWMLGASGSAVLGAYAGDDTNPSATKSWGGATLSEGDVVIGHNQSGSAAMVWDKSAGKFQFVGNGSGTVQAEIDTQGRVSAGGGKIVLGQYGARLSLGSSRTTYLSTTDGARIIWSAAEIYEALEEEYTYLSTSYYRRSLIARTITGFGTNVSHTEIAALHETTSGSGSYRGPRIILESGGHLEDYTTTYGVDDVAIVVADMLDIQASLVRIADSSLGGQLAISQGSSTGAKPPLIVGQSDVSEEMIRFNGTVATGNTLNTDALGAYYGRVKVSINGTAKWLALYS